MIDTNNFMTKTGVRTFEAAAYLRRNGADVTRVRKMFRDDAASYKAKAEIVSNAEVYDGAFAIAVTPETIIDSPTIIGAEAANELLNISGIRASFVLTMHQGEVYISARSIDDVNVQVIMERLGGGGHMNVAGAQLPNVSIEGARKALIILLQDVKSVGKKGDVVEVSDGYAKNFIFKKKLGKPADSKNMNDLKLQKANEEKMAAQNLADAQEFSKVIETRTIVVKLKAGEGDKPFGSVSSKEIAQEAKSQHDMDIDKKKIVLAEPIKAFGTFEVPVKLHPQVTATLKVKVEEC